MNTGNKPASARWLTPTVLGLGLASLFSDFSHEIATSLLPTFLATMGVAAVWLGCIEGVSDGISTLAKLGSGFYTDKLPRRKPLVVLGYLVTALGTASFGLATSAWHILMARSIAWLGRGVRSPVKKALLAGAVTRETRGRAFGFERMMDTTGAIIGPGIAGFLVVAFHNHYPPLFALTLIPGFAAVAVIAFLVKEQERKPVKHISFTERLGALPESFRKFLLAVGVFGSGDFAHSLLILFATKQLTPIYGATKAASLAISCYFARNIFNACFAPVAGWLADNFKKPVILSVGYALAAIMALLIIVLPPSLWIFFVIFIFAGIYVAVEETLEDSLCAELVPEEQQGMAYGVLATVNGVGDFISSIVVGVLMTYLGATAAFGYCAILFTLGALLVLCTVNAAAQN